MLDAKANFCRETSFGKSSVLRYQQGPTLTKRHQRRLRQQLYEREKTMEGCQRLPDLFRNAAAGTRGPVTQQMPRNLQLTGKQNCPPAPIPSNPACSPPTPAIPPDSDSDFPAIPPPGSDSDSPAIPPPGLDSLADSPPIHPPARPPNRKGRKECPEELKAPIADLEKKLQSEAIGLTGQNNTRHQAALRLLYHQRFCQNETRQTMALNVAKCFNRGRWFAEKLVSGEICWKKDRTILEGK